MGNGSFAFIVGSPRSGTTVLGEILDKHDQICQWYEPYFIIDQHFRNAPDDERQASDCTPAIRRQIFNNFLRYRKKMECAVVVDKSPRNSLKIPFLRNIFPDARFVHILRDGRDVTLSIHKEWLRRRAIAGNTEKGGEFDYLRVAKVLRKWMSRQPFLKDKLKALWFETHGHVFNKSKNLNRMRWNGDVGWGPQFRGWRELYESCSVLQFNAYQWLRCVENISKQWPHIPESSRLEIRYEALVTDPIVTVSRILEFLDLPANERSLSLMPKMKKNNFNKWRKEFNQEQLQEIRPVLDIELRKHGYSVGDSWSKRR